jgi:hypothetical protein
MALVEDWLELEIFFVERWFLVSGSSYGGKSSFIKVHGAAWLSVHVQDFA